MLGTIIEYLGFIACFFTFAMYTSTIDQIRSMRKTKKSEEVSMILYIMMFFNCFFWAMYGFFLNNYYILLPNSIGCILAALTATIIYKYN